MKKSEIWLHSSPLKGQTVFRAVLGKTTNLNLSLAIIQNDKKIKAAGEELRAVLAEKETKEIKRLRAELEKTTDDPRRLEISNEIQNNWEKFVNTKEIKDWFDEEYTELTLSRCALDKKSVEAAKFDTDQIEVLMYFTNIAELGEEMEPEKAKGKASTRSIGPTKPPRP